MSAAHRTDWVSECTCNEDIKISRSPSPEKERFRAFSWSTFIMSNIPTQEVWFVAYWSQAKKQG